MTAFVDSCVLTAAGGASAASRVTRGRPHARKLLRVLQGKKRILITTHVHPDPDALASALGLCTLLTLKLKDVEIVLSIKGRMGGGLNDAFARFATLQVEPWDESQLRSFDAIILLDVQPGFAYSPLPPDVAATAVIDHHRARRRRPQCPFCDIRIDVGATSSIVFSYFMELEETISPDLSAAMLFGIETDLAGAAGTPGELDNMALSQLTLTADTRRLYQMRYVDLPQSYFIAFASALNTAMVFDTAVTAYVDQIESLEQPAVMADMLLRYDKVQWSLVAAPMENRLLLSLRTSDARHSAGEIMRRLVRNLGEGGGHRSKAGGYIPLENGSPTEIDRIRTTLRRRLTRALGLKLSRGVRLVPPN